MWVGDHGGVTMWGGELWGSVGVILWVSVCGCFAKEGCSEAVSLCVSCVWLSVPPSGHTPTGQRSALCCRRRDRRRSHIQLFLGVHVPTAGALQRRGECVGDCGWVTVWVTGEGGG